MNQSGDTGVDPVLDALPSSVAILDGQGVILQVNRVWRAFGAANGLTMQDAGVGVNYLTLCAGAQAWEAAEGIRQVMTGVSETFVQVYPCHSADRERWFQLRAAPLDDGTGRTLLTHEDVTERVAAEQALQRHMAFLRGLTARTAMGRSWG